MERSGFVGARTALALATFLLLCVALLLNGLQDRATELSGAQEQPSSGSAARAKLDDFFDFLSRHDVFSSTQGETQELAARRTPQSATSWPSAGNRSPDRQFPQGSAEQQAFVKGEELGGQEALAAAHHILKRMDEHWRDSVTPGTAKGMQRQEKTELWSFSGLVHRIASGVEASVASALGNRDAYERNKVYETIEKGDAASSASSRVVGQPRKQQQLAAGRSSQSPGLSNEGTLQNRANLNHIEGPHLAQQARMWDPIQRRFEAEDAHKSKSGEPFLFRLAMGEIQKDKATAAKVAPAPSQHVRRHAALHRPAQPQTSHEQVRQAQEVRAAITHKQSHGEGRKRQQRTTPRGARPLETARVSRLAREAERQEAQWRRAVRWGEKEQQKQEQRGHEPQHTVQQLPIRVQVTVPPEARAGSPVEVTAHGKSFKVIVPRGKSPGDTFSAILQDEQQQLRSTLTGGESVVKTGTLNEEDDNGVLVGMKRMGGVKADDEQDSGVASGLKPMEDENDSGVTGGIQKMGAAASDDRDSGVMSDFNTVGAKPDDSSLDIAKMMKEAKASSDVPDPFGGSDGGLNKIPPAPDPFAGMDGTEMMPKHVPDPFAGHDGMGGDGKSDTNMNDISADDDDGVFGEMTHTQESMKGFKPSMPPSIESPETAGFGGLPTSPKNLVSRAPPSDGTEDAPLTDRSAASDPFGADKNEYAEAVDEAARKAEEDEAVEQKRQAGAEERREQREEEERSTRANKEKKEEEAQEVIDRKDGGHLSLPPPPSASSIYSASTNAGGGSVDSLGTIKSPTPEVADPFESGEARTSLEKETPDPFAGYDGMGGMTKKPHTEDPSVFGEMKKTYHKDAMKNFKPSLPPSIAHPHSSGIGGLPADVRAGLAPPAPESHGAPAPAAESPSAEAESNPFSAPDPLQEGESGIVDANGEDESEERQEREAEQEKGAVYEVKMAVGLPYSEEEFSHRLQVKFKAAIAMAIASSSKHVHITKISPVSARRRRLLAAGIRVDTSIRAADEDEASAVVSDLTAEKINLEFKRAGLEEGFILKQPSIFETTEDEEQEEAEQERRTEAARKAEEEKEEKEEAAQEAIDARDGGPLSLPPPPPAGAMDDEPSPIASNSADSLGDVKQIVPDAPDPFAGYDGMGGMTKKPHTEDPSVFGEMKKTYHKDAMKNFKPSVPPSIAHPHSSGIGGLPADVRAGLAPPAPESHGAPAPAAESPSAEAESNPFSAPDPLQEGESGIVDANGEDESEERQEREAEQEEQQEEAEQERRTEAARKAEEEKEEKEEAAQEAIDARDGGPLSLPPPPPAGAMDDEPSPSASNSADSLGDVKQIVPDAPDPFAGYDGMGGMTKKPHTEDPSVFGEMKKTYHKDAMKNFKPSVPPSIAHPHSSGIGGLPADVRAGLAPPAPESHGAPAPAAESPSAEAESNPFSAPDPLQEGESGIVDANGEDESEERQEREAEQEEQREEAEQERRTEVARKAEEEKEEKEEAAQEAIDARDGGPLSLPPPPPAGAMDDEPSPSASNSADSLGDVKQIVPDAPNPFHGYDGMGGMTKKPHTEDPSVFGEMKKTYHKDAMKNFKPSVPPSIAHPHSSGVGGLPADMRTSLHPPAPKEEMGSFTGAVEEGEETEEERILNRQKHQEPVGQIGDKIRGILTKSAVPDPFKGHDGMGGKSKDSTNGNGPSVMSEIKSTAAFHARRGPSVLHDSWTSDLADRPPPPHGIAHQAWRRQDVRQREAVSYWKDQDSQ